MNRRLLQALDAIDGTAITVTSAVASSEDGVSLALFCRLCREQHQLDISIEHFDVLRALVSRHPVAARIACIELAAQDVDLVPFVATCVWLLTHTTSHGEALLRERSRSVPS